MMKMLPDGFSDGEDHLILSITILLMMTGVFVFSLIKFRDIAGRVALCLILSLPIIDCLTSLALPNPAAKIIAANRQAGNKDMIVLIPGYNGYGSCLLAALEPGISARYDVIALQPSPGKYELQAITRQLHAEIAQRQPASLTIYAESMGGMVTAELLRRYPDLIVDRLILNAAPAAPDDVVDIGLLRKLHNWPAGILASSIVRINQSFDSGGPTPEAGMDPQVRAYCNTIATKITGPRAFSEMDVIANFEPTKPGELKGRVGKLTYLRAPEPADTMIKLDQAAPRWRAAMNDKNFTETKIPLWAGGIHCGTPSRPSPIIAAINNK